MVQHNLLFWDPDKLLVATEYFVSFWIIFNILFVVETINEQGVSGPPHHLPRPRAKRCAEENFPKIATVAFWALLEPNVVKIDKKFGIKPIRKFLDFGEDPGDLPPGRALAPL